VRHHKEGAGSYDPAGYLPKDVKRLRELDTSLPDPLQGRHDERRVLRSAPDNHPDPQRPLGIREKRQLVTGAAMAAAAEAKNGRSQQARADVGPYVEWIKHETSNVSEHLQHQSCHCGIKRPRKLWMALSEPFVDGIVHRVDFEKAFHLFVRRKKRAPLAVVWDGSAARTKS
jgi:hypothetical protein